MSLEVRLKIRGKLTAEAAIYLTDFYKDWFFISTLAKEPKNKFYKDSYKKLQPIFSNDTNSTDTIQNLERDILDVDLTFNDVGNISEFLFEEFLPKTLTKLTEGWYANIDLSPSRIVLLFDPKKKQITKKEVDADVDENPIGSDQWDSEYKDVTPPKWRKVLAKWIEFVADINQQQRVLSKGPAEDDLDIDQLFDLTWIYFTMLNLEDGFDHAKKKKFLSEEEIKILKPLDQKFRAYVPDDFDADEQILKDPQWIEISNVAKDVQKSLVSKLYESKEKKS